MSADLPGWVWDVIDMTSQYEEEHPTLTGRGEDESYPCLGGPLLGLIPDDVLSAAHIHRERVRQAKADAWDEGFTAHFGEHERQRKDPAYPIRRWNPYGTPSKDKP